MGTFCLKYGKKVYNYNKLTKKGLMKKLNLPKINFQKMGVGLVGGLKNSASKVKDINLSKMLIFRRRTRIAIMTILLLLLGIEIYAGVMVFGFKSERPEVKMITNIIPLPIAVVNYDVITYKQYLAEKDYIHHFYKATQQDGVDYADVDAQIMNQLIENKIIGFEALIHGVKVSKSDVDSTITDLADKNGGVEQVEKILNDLYNLNLNKFKKLVRQQMLRDKVSEEMIVRVSARHILIRVDQGATQDKIDESKTKINNIQSEITNGLDFGEAAKKYSEDTGSSEQGGLLEPFAAGEMVPEFSDAAFRTPVGQMSDPVLTDYGWHLIKVEGKTGKVEMKFTDWLNQVKDKSLILNFIK
jgi:foldase protein PrsA